MQRRQEKGGRRRRRTWDKEQPDRSLLVWCVFGKKLGIIIEFKNIVNNFFKFNEPVSTVTAPLVTDTPTSCVCTSTDPLVHVTLRPLTTDTLADLTPVSVSRVAEVAIEQASRDGVTGYEEFAL